MEIVRQAVVKGIEECFNDWFTLQKRSPKFVQRWTDDHAKVVWVRRVAWAKCKLVV